jgi:phage-related protein
MPLSISTQAIQEKNKLVSNHVWLLLLEIIYPGETPIRVCYNTENITWDGETWYAYPFELGDLSESKEGEIPTVSLGVWDIDRKITPIIDQYDGGIGAEANIYIVHSDHLDLSDPELHEPFEIIDVSIDHMNKINFNLGAENLTNYRSPPDIFLKGHCRYKEFKGPYCKYSGSEETCDRTFIQCREYGNQTNFGGFPGLGQMGLIV